MPGQGKNGIDLEVDLHGLTVEQLRVALQREWPTWRGKRAVRLITGQGTALKPEVERWCRDVGVHWEEEPYNPGSLRIFPQERWTAQTRIGTTLQEAGLKPTPEQEAYLKDPAAFERARREEQRRKAAEELRQRQEADKRREQERLDEALWQAEMRRLDATNRANRMAAASDQKPSAPKVVPKAVIKFQEGFWRSELVRIADTEEKQLRKEKVTGLDKLAPPMAEAPRTPEEEKKKGPVAPSRETAADMALFEAEMARLDQDDPHDLRREKR